MYEADYKDDMDPTHLRWPFSALKFKLTVATQFPCLLAASALYSPLSVSSAF